MKWKFWEKDPEPPTRHELDEQQLAEYQAFDNAVGAAPTQKTLRQRFERALLNGYTKVIKDTIGKGLVIHSEFRAFWMSTNGKIVNRKIQPLVVAAHNEWPDLVEVLLPYSHPKNIKQALTVAEIEKNVSISKAIRMEMSRRNIG